MRGQVAAIFALLVNIIGQGVGPTLVALFTNYLFGDERALQKSLALTAALAMPVGIAVLWSGLRPYRSAVAAMAEIGAVAEIGQPHEITQKSTPA
jgi:hypothetical protein